MPRRATGEVVERSWKHGRGFALRFSAYGRRRYLTLGYEGEGDPPLSWERADEQLQNILADVRRGIWVPPPKKKPRKKDVAAGTGGGETEVVLFGPFATELVKGRRGQVSESQTSYDEWGLGHLNPYFADRPLPEFDNECVDAYRRHKVEEAAELAEAIEKGRPRRDARGRIRRPLSAVSINKTIDVLQWVLGIAVEYKKRTGLLENPAAGPKRRLAEPDRRPVHLDTAEQIESLLVAAAELDRHPRYHCTDREAIVATLIFAGPRAHELCNLLWRDVDFTNGRIFIGRSKTKAGLREIPLVPILREILLAHRARSYRTGPDDLVFPTGTGGRRTKDNLRQRVLDPSLFERADEMLVDRGHVPLPVGVTAHKLRHTFASVMVAIGEDPVSVQKALGHTTPTFTLAVYTHLMRRDKAERDRLKALVNGERVVAVEAPRTEVVALADYELPILRGLADRGGRARAREVVDAVGEALASRHGARDLERLPSGEPRWKPRLRKARARLEQRGWIESGQGRGEWKLTGLGRAKVSREAPRRPAEEPPAPPERRLRLVA
ncbi:MAG: tyrosine-type recombinase/integrase [Actinobacteria bacterium]|nr:tyrosine-type recombinase/integrase [Actinomycetota bacterium]